MAANYTQHYQLCLWEPGDKVLREEFNADHAKIDAAIKAVDRRADALAAAKADRTALEALQAAVNTKADKTALAALQTTVSAKADQSALNAVHALAVKSRFTKLQEVVYAQALHNATVDLSGIDWGRWSKIHVDWLTNNGQQSGIYYNTVDSYHVLFGMSPVPVDQRPLHNPRMTFHVDFDPMRRLYVTMGGQGGGSTEPFSVVKSLIFSGDSLLAGAGYTVWGEE